MRMQGIYGYPWTNRWPTPEMIRVAKNEWANDLAEFSDVELDRAVGRCKARHRMPPSLIEFLACCTPEFRELGMPEVDDAYLEACRQAHCPTAPAMRWSHPAVFLAGRHVGWHDLQCGLSGIKNRYEKAYRALFRQVASGTQLEIPVPNSRALEHQAGGVKNRTEQEKQTALTRIAELKAMLGMRQANNMESTGGTHGSM